jgi:hypothetical protein
MAKKKKSTKPMHLHSRVALHMSITEKVRTLIVRCEALRDAGRSMKRAGCS